MSQACCKSIAPLEVSTRTGDTITISTVYHRVRSSVPLDIHLAQSPFRSSSCAVRTAVLCSTKAIVFHLRSAAFGGSLNVARLNLNLTLDARGRKSSPSICRHSSNPLSIGFDMSNAWGCLGSLRFHGRYSLRAPVALAAQHDCLLFCDLQLVFQQGTG